MNVHSEESAELRRSGLALWNTDVFSTKYGMRKTLDQYPEWCPAISRISIFNVQLVHVMTYL